jgi:hypothetical protein
MLVASGKNLAALSRAAALRAESVICDTLEFSENTVYGCLRRPALLLLFFVNGKCNKLYVARDITSPLINSVN